MNKRNVQLQEYIQDTNSTVRAAVMKYKTACFVIW